ncbi:MAG: hypothetical protein HPY45_13700 [Anaerolineae bacterium]|nr:hypothetical protein [Anaerolineae bacterium]
MSQLGALIGLLEISGVENIDPCPQLNQRKRQVEKQLRETLAGLQRKDLLAHPVMAAYERYYRHFDKTYHVLLQVESIAWKGKSLPDVSPLVDANFVAEMETFVLTAGHDAAKLEQPVIIDLTRAADQMTQMNGSSRLLREGDMAMRDRQGVCCTILYGQDNRSPISKETRHVLYVSYAPSGISAEVVEAQLQRIEENVRLFAPSARIEQRRLLVAKADGSKTL